MTCLEPVKLTSGSRGGSLFSRRTARLFFAAVLLVMALTPSATQAAPSTAPNCPVFPADNVWHADISKLPVHKNSEAWISSMGGPGRLLHPDFGPSGEDMPYGIPFDSVDGGHPKVQITFDGPDGGYPEESDPGPYPFDEATKIEGGLNSSGDRHALMIDRDNCVLYELYHASWNGGNPTADQGSVFDLRSNALRPAGWTSADAAGLPIFAGLIRRDEVLAGEVDHAIRVTAQQTDRSYLWPARHQAGARSDPALPPMGARFRLKAGFDISGFRPDTQVIMRAMKKHGLIVADNGSNWFFGGTAEDGWDSEMLDELKMIPAGQFEAVDASSLMVDPDSGRVLDSPPPLPVARPDVYRVNEDKLLGVPAPGVLKNDTGSRPLTAKLVSGTKRGTVRLNANGSFTYRSKPNFFGKDTFTYRAVNGAAASKAVTVTISVRPQPG